MRAQWKSSLKSCPLQPGRGQPGAESQRLHAFQQRCPGKRGRQHTPPSHRGRRRQKPTALSPVQRRERRLHLVNQHQVNARSAAEAGEGHIAVARKVVWRAQRHPMLELLAMLQPAQDGRAAVAPPQATRQVNWTRLLLLLERVQCPAAPPSGSRRRRRQRRVSIAKACCHLLQPQLELQLRADAQAGEHVLRLWQWHRPQQQARRV